MISSGTFSVSGPEWCLQIYPEGRREDTKDHVAVYLKSKNSVPVRVSFTLYVMSGEKRKDCISRVCEEVCTFQPMDSDKETRWGNREFIHEDRFEVPDFLTAEGALNVVCELTVFGREKTLTGLKIHNSSGMRQVGEDFWNLFVDSKLTDVVIHCEDETFLCHGMVLCARNAAFKEMFEAGFSEGEDMEFHIPDISSAAFKKILRFLYTGTLPTDDIQNEMWMELLRGAVKLQLDLLKRICEERLNSNE